MGYEDLTGKRRLFVDAYIGQANCCKAAAARIAGYACPGQEGYRLYQDPEVRAAIEERLRELSISPEEILARLSEQARGNMADFLAVDEAGGFRIDLTEAEQSGKLRLVKKAGYDQKGRPAIELYDAQSALLALAKRYGLFPDRSELSGPNGGPLQVGISFEEALRELRSGDGETERQSDRESREGPPGPPMLGGEADDDAADLGGAIGL